MVQIKCCQTKEHTVNSKRSYTPR